MRERQMDEHVRARASQPWRHSHGIRTSITGLRRVSRLHWARLCCYQASMLAPSQASTSGHFRAGWPAGPARRIGSILLAKRRDDLMGRLLAGLGHEPFVRCQHNDVQGDAEIQGVFGVVPSRAELPE